MIEDQSSFTKRSRGSSLEGSILKYIFLACASLSILTTLAILLTLSYQAYEFFKEISIITTGKKPNFNGIFDVFHNLSKI